MSEKESQNTKCIALEREITLLESTFEGHKRTAKSLYERAHKLPRNKTAEQNAEKYEYLDQAKTEIMLAKADHDKLAELKKQDLHQACGIQ